MMRDGKVHEGFTLIELMISIVIIGILAVIATVGFINMQQRAKEAAVRNNAHTTQLAAEEFATQNNGDYAIDTASASSEGGTLIDLLPRGERLRNPFTAVSDSPVDGEAAAVGVVGYVGRDNDGDGIADGYEITGHGVHGLIFTVRNGS